MSYYLTGVTRTRTLVVDVAFTDTSGTYTGEGVVRLGGGATVAWTAVWSDYSGGGGGGGGGLVEDGDEVLPPAGRRCTLTISTGVSGSSTTTTYTIDDPTDFTGTVTLSVATREVADVGYRFGVMEWGARVLEYQYGTATASCTLLGQSQSNSGSAGTSLINAQWTLRSEITVAGSGGAGGQALTVNTAPCTGTVSATTATKSKSATYSAGGISYTYSNDAEATATSVETNASASSTPSGFASANPIAVSILRPDIEATVVGLLQRLPAAYASPIEYRLYDGGTWTTDTNGEFSANVSLKEYATSVTITDHTGTSGLGGQNYFANERVPIKPAWRYPGDVLPQARFETYGPRWNAIGLAWTSTQTVDNGSTLSPTGAFGGSWSGSSGGSVAVVSGAIQITGSTGKKATRTVTGATWNAYTRLRIRLKSSNASHNITVRLGADSTTYGVTYRAKRWSLTTGAAGTYEYLYIDLGAETSGPTYSTWDTAGNVSIGNFTASIDPGSGYGYNSAYHTTTGTLVFEDLDGGTYDIDEIVAMTGPDGLGGHTSPLIHIDPPGSATSYRLLVGTCDGQQVLTVGADSTGVLRGVTLAQLVGYVTGTNYTGWSATSLAPATSPDPAEPWPLSELTTNRHPALFLGGGGVLWDGSTQTWALQYDAGAVGPGDMVAQWRVYDVLWDWSDTTCAGFRTLDTGVYYLGSAWLIGGSVWGRVFDTTTGQTPGDETAPCGRDPKSGAVVSLIDGGGAVIATETTGADGLFRLPALAELGGSARVTCTGRTGYLDVPMWTAPGRARLCLMSETPPTGTLLAMACSATGRVVRGYLDGSNNLLLEFWVRTAWEPHTTGLTITGNGAMAYDTSSGLSRLHLLYEDSGAIKGRYTDDEGSTWSVATTIAAAGTYPAICISPTQARHHFWYDGGAIKTLITDSLGTTTTSATTVVTSGVASSPIDAVHDGKLVLLTYKTSGGAVVTVVSTDGGVTFS